MTIRSIKPELFTDKKLLAVSREARLCFIGLITLADNRGRLRAGRRRLAANLFEDDADLFDGIKLDGWLAQLAAVGLVELYEGNGEQLAYLPNFRKHQKIDPRYEGSTLPPAPSEAAPTVIEVGPTKVPSAPTSIGVMEGEVDREVENGGGGGAPPAKTLPAQKPQKKNGSRQDFEVEQWADGPEKLLEIPLSKIGSNLPAKTGMGPDATVGTYLAAEFIAFDGKRGRPLLLTVLRSKWEAIDKQFNIHGPRRAYASLLTWMSDGYRSALFGWEKDGGLDPAAFQAPPPKPVRTGKGREEDTDVSA